MFAGGRGRVWDEFDWGLGLSGQRDIEKFEKLEIDGWGNWE